jgi:hypothetical protein
VKRVASRYFALGLAALASASHAPAAAALAALIALGCASPTLADLPARCSDGVCPEGYDCIHGVCAKPGTKVPITVASLPYLRGVDLKIVPQSSSALVVWQTYAYSATGQRFVGARVSAGGAVSREMVLVSSFVADEGATEPFFDVLRAGDDDLLLAVSAPPLADDPAPEPRLITYQVDLPPEGSEAQGAQFGAAWGEEARVGTIGYGAVSRPKLLKRENHIELGCVQTRTDISSGVPQTIGELLVRSLGDDGALLPVPTGVYPARAGLPVAVGVIDAFEGATGAFWILDNERPSVLLATDDGLSIERPLERLAVAASAAGSSLSYIKPSPRLGDKLPSGPVAGPSELHRVDHALAGGNPAGELLDVVVSAALPLMRDTPRPVWIPREGKPALVVTPGAEVASPSIFVYTVDPASGAATLAASVDRFSTSDLVAIAAALAGGSLYIAWADGISTATVRVAIVPEP